MKALFDAADEAKRARLRRVWEEFGGSSLRTNVKYLRYFAETKTVFKFRSNGDKVVVMFGERQLAVIDGDVIIAPARKEGDTHWNQLLNQIPLVPDVTYKVDDFEYLTDGLGRVVRTRAFLKNMPGIRNGHQQTNSVVWKDGDKALDDGGHIIAARFLGPGEQINYYPLLRKLNRSGGQWNEMENELSIIASEDGVIIEVAILASFDSNSRRPSSLTVRVGKNGEHVKDYRFHNLD